MSLSTTNPSFQTNDIILAKRIDLAANGDSSTVYEIQAQVTSVDEYGVYQLHILAGESYMPVYGAESEWVKVGNTSNSARQGSIYLTAVGANSPYIDIYNGVTSFDSAVSGGFGNISTIKVRLGNLAGITDANFGTLTGHGIYTNAGYFSGSIALGAATSFTAGIGVWADDTGNLRAGNPAGNYFQYKAADGTVTVKGSITVIDGTLAGMTISSTALTATSGGNSTIVSSGSTAFSCGTTGSPQFTVTQAGLVTCSNITITGGNVSAVTLTSIDNIPIIDGLTLTDHYPDPPGTSHAVGYSQFTVRYKDTTYTIPAGNTLFHYNWWSLADPDALFSDDTLPAMGNDIFLIFMNQFTAGVHTGHGIKSLFQNVIYADFISVNTLAAIQVSTGNLTVSGALSMGTGGVISSGQTAYDTGTGYWLEYNGGTPRFSLGNAAGNKLTWNGSALGITGAITGGTLDVGGDDATSFHVDADGNMWSGAATYNTSTNPFSVTNAGILRATGATIKSATSGQRIEILSSTNQIDFYNTSAIVCTMSGVVDGGLNYLTLNSSENISIEAYGKLELVCSNSDLLFSAGLYEVDCQSIMNFMSGVKYNVVVTALDYTATSANSIIISTATVAKTITLPAVSHTGLVITVKRTIAGPYAVTIDGAGAETIDGAANTTLNAQYNYITLVSNGTEWNKIAGG